MDKHPDDMIAIEATARDGQIFLRLLDGSTHSFPAQYYPRLAPATPAQLSALRLRVGGRALRWDEIDEDIWVKDAILGLYPAPIATAAAG